MTCFYVILPIELFWLDADLFRTVDGFVEGLSFLSFLRIIVRVFNGLCLWSLGTIKSLPIHHEPIDEIKSHEKSILVKFDFKSSISNEKQKKSLNC